MKFLIDNYTNNQTIKETKVNPEHSDKLPTQSQQRYHENKMQNNTKVNNKDTRAASMAALWCIHCKPKAHETTRPSATAIDSEQENARWYVSCYFANNHHPSYSHSNNGLNNC